MLDIGYAISRAGYNPLSIFGDCGFSPLVACYFVLTIATAATSLCQANTSYVEGLRLVDDIETPRNDTTHLWGWVSSINIDESGKRLAMFNNKPPRVSILSTDNLDLISSWGTEGRGPGEFLVTNSWVGFRNSVLYVFQGHRTSLFTLRGEHLDKDHPEKRTAWANSRVDWTSGLDDDGNCYFWDEGLAASHVVIRRTPEGKLQKLIDRKKLPLEPQSFSELAVRFGVLRRGDVIATFKEPFVLRTDANGVVRWIRNLVQLVPMLRAEYDAVEKKESLFPLTAFWADQEYVVLSYANPTQRIRHPMNFFVVLDSEKGDLLRVVYAPENVRRQPPESVNADKDESISYVPSEIAREGKHLFVFSINSARLRKYELLW